MEGISRRRARTNATQERRSGLALLSPDQETCDAHGFGTRLGKCHCPAAPSPKGAQSWVEKLRCGWWSAQSPLQGRLNDSAIAQAIQDPSSACDPSRGGDDRASSLRARYSHWCTRFSLTL